MAEKLHPFHRVLNALTSGEGEAEVWCEFCEGEPTRTKFTVLYDREVTSILLRKGWSILRGKEMCPACSRRVFEMLKGPPE